MSLFTGSSSYYRQYRPGIPALARRLASYAPECQPRRLLDVGTGTSLVAEALMAYFSDVIGFDNDPDRSPSPKRYFDRKIPRDSTLTLVIHRRKLLPPDRWSADLVTICRAFRWLDRPAVLGTAELPSHRGLCGSSLQRPQLLGCRRTTGGRGQSGRPGLPRRGTPRYEATFRTAPTVRLWRNLTQTRRKFMVPVTRQWNEFQPSCRKSFPTSPITITFTRPQPVLVHRGQQSVPDEHHRGPPKLRTAELPAS